MPNWCCNTATITCPTKEIYEDLLDSIKENTWFDTFAPLNLDPEVYENGWDYHTAIEVWNTKWSATGVEILSEDAETFELILSFETAWTPPTGVYSIMLKKFGIETIGMFDESGCCFFGNCIYAKECEVENYYDFPSNETELQELQKTIGSELDNYMSCTWEQLREDWDSDVDCENNGKEDS